MTEEHTPDTDCSSQGPIGLATTETTIPDENIDSIASVITKKELNYPGRIKEIIDGQDAGLEVQITDACKSTDSHSHQLQGFVVYFIQFGPIAVKRRYSEFESLRLLLIKEFPTLIIPPIPEKQSLKSNIVLTTSTISNNLTDHNNGIDNDKTDSLLIRNNESDPMLNLVEYRKRMLAAFLNKCLKIKKIANSRFFLHFLDPEINFQDYINDKENSLFCKTSIFQLSPFDPIKNLENQLYLTLPIPSSSDSHLFKELSEEEQFQKFVSFEMKFLKYELVLNNISKINKRLIRHINELSTELSELGSNFNQLSLIQDSNSIEHIGKLFERHTILLLSLSNSINVGFLDKLIELKHFSTTCKELMEYNRKKILQFKLIEKELYNTRSRYKRYETEEIRIRKIDQKMDKALNHSYNDTNGASPDTDEYFEPPITDEELQTALYSKSFNKTVYGKIPGVSKLNNMILKYVNDPNPDETRRNKFYNLKLRLFQLEKQYQISQHDLDFINKDVMIQLNEFHQWFKTELSVVSTAYNLFLSDYFGKSIEPWLESCSQ
jgi:hypothetical protein